MKRFLIPALAASLLILNSCDNAEEEAARAEAEELLARIAQLEKERKSGTSLRNAALQAELDKSREELRIALTALEAEGLELKEGAEEAGVEVDVVGAPKAVEATT